ncbi:cryptochrome/photolyase family protein [Carnimonas nigrificans]|uniref:cryptochrome/photolyase family protein n=1 Tax=Carnimonas nigrificans TaxID=64323 RepID=UPI000470B4F6|nr:FAD-binding domain-containing protein [Carnimonas nigrificans]
MSDLHLVWLRNDLRIDDNRALAAAARQGKVVALLAPCYAQMSRHSHGGNKQEFWYRCAQSAKQQLEALHIPVLVLSADSFDEVPGQLLAKAKESGATHLHFNDEYALNERTRDSQVIKAAQKAGLKVTRYTDMIQYAPSPLLTGKDEFYSVFTPFARAWHRYLSAEQLAPSPPPERQVKPRGISSDTLPPPTLTPGKAAQLWPAGSEAAQSRLSRFLQGPIKGYSETRDFPALDGTSTLSPYLAVGAISSRQCLNAVLHHNNGHLSDGDAGTTAWVNELVWREFYQHIMVGFPRVCRHQPFKEAGNKMKWRDAADDLAAWKAGRTGYPIVDAAMKQLVASGWMHNRLRMVVSMFLTKHLLINWHEGEAFFLEHLIDGEFGANNGGWQWSASTGTDASSYFRLFNSTTQSQRFDKKGEFLTQWLDGFETLDAKSRHNPGNEQRKALDYPLPIVDHRAARERALAAFAKAFKRDSQAPKAPVGS